jgi:hypothetical protein
VVVVVKKKGKKKKEEEKKEEEEKKKKEKKITNLRPGHGIYLYCTSALQLMSAVAFVSLLTAACCIESVYPSLMSANM